MNKSILTISAGAIILIALSSCSSLHHTASTATVDSEIYTRTVAELDVAPSRVSKTTEWKWNPFNSVSVINEKKTATAELLKEVNADVLVEPDYQVKRRGIFRGGSLTVTGFPAKYTNFRPMTKEDAEVIDLANGGSGRTRLTAVQTTATSKPIAPSSLNKSHRPKGVNYGNRQFIDFIASASLYSSNTEKVRGCAFGAMWGKTWNRWGMYTKGLFNVTTSTWDVAFGGQFTIGVVKTLGEKWNLFAGAGAGYTPTYEFDSDYGDFNCFTCAFCIPVDLGIQWHINKFNIMAGLSVELFTEYDPNINPFIGIGYSF